MSRYREADLAYGEIPQRWDRERFERIGSRGGGPRFEEDYQYEERERPGRRDVLVADQIDGRESRGRFEESDRFFEEQEARARAASRRRRRTDRELFGDIDPREVADMALAPYVPPQRPGIIRRQSSLDTFDRRSTRRGKEDYRIPAYTPVPLPVRRRHHHHHHDDWEEPEDYREVEIRRERSVHRRRGPRPPREESKAPSSSSSSSSSSNTEYVPPPPKSRATSHAPSRAPSRAPSTKPPREIVQETTIEKISSPPPAPSVKSSSFEASVREERRFKKGKTRMPKRLVRLEAIMDLGYPFDEEEDFFVLRIALEKEQIDEVIQISETYKDGEKKKVYRFEKTVEEEDTPIVGEREEIERTEWINPPTVVGARSRAKSIRGASPSAKSSISRRDSPRTRRPSSPGTYVERQTIIEEHRSPPPPPPPAAPEYYEREEHIVEERTPTQHHHHHDHHGGALIVQEREYRSDRDINAEIRALETERRALRFEREAEQKRDMAVRLRERRSADDLQLVEYRRPAREELVVYEREKSPPRNVIRVEKDRKAAKERKKKKLYGAAVATLM